MNRAGKRLHDIYQFEPLIFVDASVSKDLIHSNLQLIKGPAAFGLSKPINPHLKGSRLIVCNNAIGQDSHRKTNQLIDSLAVVIEQIECKGRHWLPVIVE